MSTLGSLARDNDLLRRDAFAGTRLRHGGRRLAGKMDRQDDCSEHREHRHLHPAGHDEEGRLQPENDIIAVPTTSSLSETFICFVHEIRGDMNRK